ncbi:MAG: PucC family protein [Verrucomicrobiae bacterium]|nr:PucC family protein [Verrucomicrobiae bacterium]
MLPTPSPDTLYSDDEHANSQNKNLHRCGNLTYTKMGLAALFGWLLWGDFCFTLMEAVVPSILPLKLRSLESSNWLIGAIMSTLPGVFNTTICPWVSFKSDRYRSKWGRRIPFILYTMPFLTLSLILIGYSDSIGVWLHSLCFQDGGVRQAAVVITLLAVFAGCFDLFNMFVGSVYWYLFNDVVPEKFLARFMAYFRLVGVISSAGFNFFIFKYAESHMREIYLGAAVLYFLGFGIMCLKVRERAYPPPPDTGLKPSLWRDIKTFARESYSISYYWTIFLNTVFGAVAACMAPFMIFFYKSLDMDLDMIGKFTAADGILVAGCLSFIGGFVDRWHPVRVMAYIAPFTIVLTLNPCVWIFVDSPPPTLFFWSTIVCSFFSCLLLSAQQAAALPRQMELFPQDRFGQFCGAQALVRSGATMIGGVLAGLFIDFAKNLFPSGLYAYRFLFLWQTLFMIMAFIFHYRAYRVWKRLGADKGYSPPTQPFSIKKLLFSPPSSAGEPALASVNSRLAQIVLMGFGGIVVFDLSFLVYFFFFSHQNQNAMTFLIQTGIILALIPLYLRLLRFMERP